MNDRGNAGMVREITESCFPGRFPEISASPRNRELPCFQCYVGRGRYRANRADTGA
jgi:hypothetical protein